MLVIFLFQGDVKKEREERELREKEKEELLENVERNKAIKIDSDAAAPQGDAKINPNGTFFKDGSAGYDSS